MPLRLSSLSEHAPLIHGVMFCYFIIALPVEKLSASAVSFAVLLCLIVWQRSLFKQALAGRGPLLWAGCLFLLTGWLASDVLRVSAKGGYDLIRAFGVFFIGHYLGAKLLAWSGLGRLTPVSYWLVGSVTLLYLGFAIASGTVIFREATLIYTAWGNLHEFAILVAMVALLVGWSLRWVVTSRQQSLVFLVMLLLLLLMLVGTTSKGNLLALGSALLVVFGAGHRHWRKVWIASLSAALSIYIYLFFIHFGACVGEVCLGHTFEARKEIFLHTWHLILERPWVGHGFGMFKHVSQLVIDGHTVIMPHNVYLELIFSSGLLGALLLAVFLFALMPRGNTRQEGTLTVAAALKVLALSVLVFLAVRGLVDFKLASFEFLGAFFFALGVYSVSARAQNYKSSDGVIE